MLDAVSIFLLVFFLYIFIGLRTDVIFKYSVKVVQLLLMDRVMNHSENNLVRTNSRIEALLPENQLLQENFLHIRREIMAYVEANHQEMESFNKSYSFKPGKGQNLENWKYKTLYMFGRFDFDVLETMPILGSIVYKLSENKALYNVSLSILKDKQSLDFHVDTSNVTLRYHLPISISREGHCRFHVKDVSWLLAENSPFIFNPRCLHAVENELDSLRIHLMIDFLNPAFNFMRYTKWFFLLSKTVGSVRKKLQPLPSIVVSLTRPKFGNLLGFWKDIYINLPKDVCHILHQSQDLSISKLIPDVNKQKHYLSLIAKLHYANKHHCYILSMLPKARLMHLYFFIKYIEKEKISGVFVEAGVWRGGTGILFSTISSREIFLLDSFESMEDIANSVDVDDIEIDKDCSKLLNKFRTLYGEEVIGSSIDEVEKNFYDYFEAVPKKVHLMKGWFDSPDYDWDAIDEIVILRLDCDYYKPTKICLEKLYDKVVSGGVVVLDEYRLEFMGERKAVDEFREKNKVDSPIIHIDDHASYWVKS